MSEICEVVAQLFQSASVIEFTLLKPGNVSPYGSAKDEYNRFVESSIYLDRVYRKICEKGIKGDTLIFDIVYNTITKVKKRFSLFGTMITVAPLVYVVVNSNNIHDVLLKATDFLRKNDDVRNSFYFIESLKVINPSYLGKIDKSFDYRSNEIKQLRIFDILRASFYEDIIAYNMINNYSLSLDVYSYLINKNYTSFYESIIDAYVHLTLKYGDTVLLKSKGLYFMRELKNILRINSQRIRNDLNYALRLDKWLASKRVKLGSIADIISSGIALYYLKEVLLS